MILCILATILVSSAKTPESPRHVASAEEIVPTSLFDKDGNLLPEDPNNSQVNWETLNNQSGQNNQWKSVGLLSTDGNPSCSTTVFQIPNCSDTNRKAQILTNGHCTLKGKHMSVQFNKFSDSKTSDLHQAQIERNLFSSYINGIDVAILELDESYADLNRMGIKATEVATQPPENGQKLTATGFPAVEPRLMRQSECTLIKRTTTIDTTQMWPNAIMLDRCSIMHGSSGSSLISDGKIYGVINAGNINSTPNKGHEACEMDTCIFDANSQPSRPQKNFGFDVTFLHKCYKDCKLDTHLPGCPMPNLDSQISASSNSPHPSAWTDDLKKKINLSSRFDKYQIKGCTAGLGSCDCNDSSGYKNASTTNIKTDSSGKTINQISPIDYLSNATNPAVAGEASSFHFLCVRGINDDGSLDDIKNVKYVPIYLFKQNSTPPPLVK